MSIAVVGEALIDFISGDDGAYRPHLGGSPFNVAIGVARQGMAVSYLSPFSDDAFGDMLLAALQREGVTVANPRRSPWPTSLAMVTVDDAGIPAYRLYREGVADKDTTLEELLSLLPPELSVFHTGSLAITPSQLPKLKQLFTGLRARGVLLSVDINIRLKASIDTQAYLDGVRSLFPLCDVLKASDEDLQAMGFREPPDEAARAVQGQMPPGGIVLLTEGRGGVLLVDASGEIRRPAFAITRVQDTVGAGDTFHSAFIASVVRRGAVVNGRVRLPRAALSEVLDFACAAAAINVSRRGCSPPSESEVLEFLAATDRGS
ncbi:MAG: PfkB family carbohydrate kinase [Pseudomonadota bacterium]